MTMRAFCGYCAACMFAALLAIGAAAAAQPAPRLDADGTVHADGVTVGISLFLSPEAHAAEIAHLHEAGPPPPALVGIEKVRDYSRAYHSKVAARWLALHPSSIETAVMNGVPVEIIKPKSGIAPGNEQRVLINLHGGAFNRGAQFIGQTESIPVAAAGGVTVVSVNYRMAPEFVFPAASEDVEAVYRALLQHYKPANIGLYGCSAGGALTGEAVAWLQQRGLPLPGAVGVFCSGLLPGLWVGGDSAALATTLNAFPPQPAPEPGKSLAPRSYFEGADPRDPLVSPASSPALLAKFPPTLLVTGTRDFAMSNALATHLKLLEAGVDAQLLVTEGMGHGQFILFAGSPEAENITAQIWKFFDRHLGKT